MAQIDPYNAIYTKLTASQVAGSLYDDVGGRIRLVQASQDEALPLLIYTPVSDVPTSYFNGTDDLEFLFQVDLYFPATSKPEDTLATNQKLITLLHKQAVTITNHGNGQAWCLDKGSVVREDDDAWRVTSQWKLLGTSNS